MYYVTHDISLKLHENEFMACPTSVQVCTYCTAQKIYVVYSPSISLGDSSLFVYSIHHTALKLLLYTRRQTLTSQGTFSIAFDSLKTIIICCINIRHVFEDIHTIELHYFYLKRPYSSNCQETNKIMEDTGFFFDFRKEERTINQRTCMLENKEVLKKQPTQPSPIKGHLSCPICEWVFMNCHFVTWKKGLVCIQLFNMHHLPTPTSDLWHPSILFTYQKMASCLSFIISGPGS